MSDMHNQDNMIVTAIDVNFSTAGQRLLSDISVHIASGNITMVLGHNGAGKSLLLSALHGLIKPQRGLILGPPRQKQRMVFQKPILLRRSAREHFEFLCPGLDDHSTQTWFERANLQPRMTTPARQLSGGESQKLALIGALAGQPDLLFLDEPTAHLDFESTGFIESQIAAARKADTSIVMTSHNRAQAERLAEHVIFMENGKVIEVATAKTFFSSPQTKAAKTYLKHN